MILAGDIGGTNARLVLLERGGRPTEFVHERRYRTREHASLRAVIRRFLDEVGAGPTSAAAFGFAGPVFEGRAHATNADWVIDAIQISAALDGIPVQIVNDLESTGLGIPHLVPDRLLTLRAGEPYERGNAALIAAGTGLGEAILVRDGGGFRPIPSEGGHSDFAPLDEEQDDLLHHLRADLGRVDAEHVLSGPGLARIHGFLLAQPGAHEEPSVLARMQQEDVARVVSESALAGRSELCDRALRLFCRAYGAEAKNLALKALATGGIFIGGGIAPKIAPALANGAFLAAFDDHPALRPVLSRIPVRVILEENTSLIGAAALALSLAG